ncbi:MAG: cell division protein ZapA [Clostridia bacterium]|nr:cell division protein ZapA [Clostridia bacterium]
MMMNMPKQTQTVKLNIAGTEYSIVSTEPTSYMLELGTQVDHDMRELLNDPRLSTTMAAVMVALNNADALKKAEQTADNLRSQMKNYLDDNARSRSESDGIRRELERLREENRKLRERLGQ